MPAVKRVGTVAAAQVVIAQVAGQRIPAQTADQDVVTAQACQRVVTGFAQQLVEGIVAAKDVVMGRSLQALDREEGVDPQATCVLVFSKGGTSQSGITFLSETPPLTPANNSGTRLLHGSYQDLRPRRARA